MIMRIIRMPARLPHLLMLLLFALGSQSLCGQDLASPRFFKLQFQSLGQTVAPVVPRNAKFEDPDDLDEEPNFLIESSLRFPIKLKGQTRIFGEVGFKNEFVYGFYSSEEQELETMELFQADFSLIAQHKFNQGLTLSNALSVSSRSSSALDLDRQALRFSNLSMLEKQLPNGEWGIGAAVTYNQRLSIIPLVKYKAVFAKGWSLDLLLPAKALLIKNLVGNARVMVGFRGSTANYFVHAGDLEMNTPGDARYRRMNVNGLVAYERLLTPWLGFSSELGINMPLRSGLYDPNDPALEIHSFQNRVSPHFKVGLFLCIPESFLGMNRN